MKILIAMSGGVDSAVTAYLLRGEHEALGVTMRLHSESNGLIYGENSCCTDEDIRDAREVCDMLGIGHRVCDFGADFRACVIEDFINSYKNGSTPNPCIVCNREIKFKRLLDMALEESFDAVATGHYAKVEKDTNGRFLLKKATDETKDQSYVLYSLSQAQLSKTVLPLGGLRKSEVRELAAANGFASARKRDSQDICFIPDGDYASFIEKLTGESFPAGNFIDINGNILGRHAGIIRYTTGQRKGLGIALGEPMYVLGKNLADNTVTLVRNAELFSKTLTAHSLNLIACDKLDSSIRVKAKIRYKKCEEWATVTQTDTDRIRVDFDEPQRAITRGQSVVLYDGDTVIGGGIID